MIVWETKSEGFPWTIARNASPTDEHLRTRCPCQHDDPSGLRPRDRTRHPGKVGMRSRRPRTNNLHINDERRAAAMQRILAVCHIWEEEQMAGDARTSATIPMTVANRYMDHTRRICADGTSRRNGIGGRSPDVGDVPCATVISYTSRDCSFASSGRLKTDASLRASRCPVVRAKSTPLRWKSLNSTIWRCTDGGTSP